MDIDTSRSGMLRRRDDAGRRPLRATGRRRGEWAHARRRAPSLVATTRSRQRLHPDQPARFRPRGRPGGGARRRSGVGLAVILVGLPILAVGLLTARGFAFVERRRLGRLLGTPMAHPTYLVLRPRGVGDLRRLTAPARDPQSWLDVVWIVVAVFTATIALGDRRGLVGGGDRRHDVRHLGAGRSPRHATRVTLASLLGFGTS